MTRSSKAFNVNHFEGWIGWSLEVQNFATLLNLEFYGGKVGGIEQHDFNTDFRQEFSKDFVGAAVSILDRNHTVTRL